MVLDVMRHRLILSYEALSDNVTSDMILDAGDGADAQRPCCP